MFLANERLSVNDNLTISKFEGKIGMKNIFEKYQIPNPKVFWISSSPFSEVDLESEICAALNANAGKPLVAKPAHLTTGNSIYFIDPNKNISIPKPTGPGQLVMTNRSNQALL